MPIDPTKTTIHIFGAGIAGLTAAHELAVRGFKVKVIERDPAGLVDQLGTPCAIGGMARTQWANLDWPIPDAPPAAVDPDKYIPPLRAPIDVSMYQLDLGGGKTLADPANQKTLTGLAQLLKVNSRATLVIRAQSGLSAAETVKEALLALGVTPADRIMRNANPDMKADTIVFMLNKVDVAGEHGFRFFPSFYSHVFDTMRRTPIPANRRGQTEVGASVYDNLVPSEVLGVGVARSRSFFRFERKRANSFQALRELLGNILGALDYTLRDVALLELAMFKYMTSSPARRAGYEEISWLEFVRAERFSAACRDNLDSTPQTFGALRARDADARTQGSSTIQLMFDQLSSGDQADYTLNGPTSTAWFGHWVDYLGTLGVTFHNGELAGLDENRRPRLKAPIDGVSFDDDSFYVLALSLPEMRDLVDSLAQLGAASKKNDFASVAAFLPADWRTRLNGPVRSDLPIQHLSGIQYYFASDTTFARGHTLFVDSPWGLTSISQPQFWARKRTENDQYQGVLSVDIADWYTPGSSGKCAWQCTADEIAVEVWRQVRASFPDEMAAQLPAPMHYHLDDKIEFGSDGLPKENHSPFLVNRKQQFKVRPGVPGHYEAHDGRWVLAGAYLQTFTRLTTMESANESARHAVNALLDRFGFQGARCDIWDPEARELADLDTLKALDAKLFERGAPHFLDILEIDRVPEQLLSRDPNAGAGGTTP